MKKILVIAPHPDDELLGAGGMILKNLKAGHEVYVCVVTIGTPPLFTNIELNKKNQQDAVACHKAMGITKTYFLDFPSTMLESIPRYELNGKILDVVRDVQPEEVYIPHYGDMQKDHQMVADAAMVAVRPKYFPQVKRVYAYETLSETGWNAPSVANVFIPNVWIDISDVLEDKLKALSYYTLQISDYPDPRSVEAVRALAMYRGSQMLYKAAEAFQLIRELRY